MKLQDSLLGLILFSWAVFGLALIRADYAIQSGNAYVPSGSIAFETIIFICLLIGSTYYFINEMVSHR